MQKLTSILSERQIEAMKGMIVDRKWCKGELTAGGEDISDRDQIASVAYKNPNHWTNTDLLFLFDKLRKFNGYFRYPNFTWEMFLVELNSIVSIDHHDNDATDLDDVLDMEETVAYIENPTHTISFMKHAPMNKGCADVLEAIDIIGNLKAIQIAELLGIDSIKSSQALQVLQAMCLVERVPASRLWRVTKHRANYAIDVLS